MLKAPTIIFFAIIVYSRYFYKNRTKFSLKLRKIVNLIIYHRYVIFNDVKKRPVINTA